HIYTLSLHDALPIFLPTPPKKIWICSNKALSLTCRPIEKTARVRKPNFLALFFSKAKLKQARASQKPVTNQGLSLPSDSFTVDGKLASATTPSLQSKLS